MGKAVLISIQPKWCELIANGKKTLEVRKAKPKLETPFKCYIYCTLGCQRWRSTERELQLFFGTGSELSNGKVIGEFVCDGFDEFNPTDIGVKFKRFMALHETGLSVKEMRNYLNGKTGYGWHISDLVIYDEPKELSEFLNPCIYPEMPYCPGCPMGYEYISETEAEFYRVDGTCDTEWICLNHLKRAPQSWCYVEELKGGASE